MPRYLHKLTDSDLPDALCEEPTGDATADWDDVTCPDCLDIQEGLRMFPPVGKPKMVMRSLRVPEKLWDEARAKADERRENISDVIREALERYVKRR